MPMEAKVTKMESLPMAQLEVGQAEIVLPHHRNSSPDAAVSAELGSCNAPLNQKLMSAEVQNAEENLSCSSKGLASDPVCWLTPPSTPQRLGLTETEAEAAAEVEADGQEENDLQRQNAGHNHSAGKHLKGNDIQSLLFAEVWITSVQTIFCMYERESISCFYGNIRFYGNICQKISPFSTVLSVFVKYSHGMQNARNNEACLIFLFAKHTML